MPNKTEKYGLSLNLAIITEHQCLHHVIVIKASTCQV